MEKQTITIKLKPYLQEYLMCKLNDKLVISNTNIIGAMLYPFIKPIPKGYIPLKHDGPEYITFELNELAKGFNIQRGKFVSDENQRIFERMLEIHFFDIFFSYIDDKIRYNKEIKKCIIQFCADYNLSYSYITYEMLKKRYYRRNILNNKKFVGKLSLTCPLLFLM